MADHGQGLQVSAPVVVHHALGTPGGARRVVDRQQRALVVGRDRQRGGVGDTAPRTRRLPGSARAGAPTRRTRRRPGRRTADRARAPHASSAPGCTPPHPRTAGCSPPPAARLPTAPRSWPPAARGCSGPAPPPVAHPREGPMRRRAGGTARASLSRSSAASPSTTAMRSPCAAAARSRYETGVSGSNDSVSSESGIVASRAASSDLQRFCSAFSRWSVRRQWRGTGR